MKPGDIIFIRGNSLISKIIRFFDPGHFSHVVIAISENKVLEAQYGTKVHINEIDLTNKFYKIIDIGLSDEERDKVVHLGIELIGKRYDYLQILGYIIRKFYKPFQSNFFNSPNNLICSELVYILLKRLGKIDEKTDLIDATPNELYRYLTNNFRRKGVTSSD